MRHRHDEEVIWPPRAAAGSGLTLLAVQVKTVGSGTITWNASTTAIHVVLVAGGGGGGLAESTSNQSSAAGGGGGGGTSFLWKTSSLGASALYVVGAAGVGGIIGVSSATAGGSSWLGGASEWSGNWLHATGGWPGTNGSTSAGASWAAGGDRGWSDTDTWGCDGQIGGMGKQITHGVGWGGDGGNSYYPGAGIGGRNIATGIVGEDAARYGSGGGGATAYHNGTTADNNGGGDGSAGVMIVWEYG